MFFCLNQSLVLYCHYNISQRALCGSKLRILLKITNARIAHEHGDPEIVGPDCVKSVQSA